MPFVFLLALLTGCASLREEIGISSPEPPPVLQLEVDAPDDLKRLLQSDLDLARLPRLAAGRPLPPRELERLVAAAPEQVRSLAETEGYFTPQVSVQQQAGEPPVVRIAVQPGPRTTVREVALQVRGPLAEATARDEPAAREAQKALRHDWALPPGAPFRNAEWSSTKTGALARLRGQGYASADWASTLARVDAALHVVDLALTADSGPLFLTGELRIEGLQAHDERTVRNLVDFGPGQPATEKRLLDAQERLQKSGLFDRASVQLDATAPDPAAAPVVVRVGERELQEATLGIGIGTDVGARGTLLHIHRRPFGRAATARNQFELGTVRQAWEGEFSSHTLPGLHRNLVGGAAERIESDVDVVSSLRLRAGRARDGIETERLVFVELERSLRRTPAFTQKSDALSAHYHGIWRRVDNVLLPTTGRIGALQLGAGQASTDPGGKGPFGRVYGRAVGYWPVGRWFGQLRLEAGQVFSRDDVVPPESMLFRAGGETSVRGYEYRSLAPVVNGVRTPGKVLFTASAEIARPFIERLPELWGAVFVDAGRAAQRWGDLEPAVGYGVGVRYRSPIGPLSLDLAYGQEVRKFRLHLSVGVTF